MHILLIHQAFVSPKEGGGTRHYELAQHCRAAGHEFTVVASILSYLSGERTVAGKGLVIEDDVDGIRVLRAYAYPALHRSFAWRVFSFFSFMVSSVIAGLRAKHVDLVMGTSPPIFQAFSAWVVAVIKRKPFLLEVRDLWPEFAIDMGVLKNPVLIKLSRWLENFLYRKATHIVVNSPAYRDYLQGKHVSLEKITVIPNGVESRLFNPDARGEAIREQWQLDGKFVVTYAGALGMANDIQTLLEAARALQAKNDIHFLLVGDGRERENLETQVKTWGLRNVTFTGIQPKSMMPEFLAASDVCVATLLDIPMFKMTYPNKVFDYMAAGRPTVLAIDGVIREVIEEASGGVFVPPGDSQKLAITIEDLWKNPEAVRAIGTAARAYVIAHFEREVQAQEFVALLDKLCRE